MRPSALIEICVHRWKSFEPSEGRLTLRTCSVQRSRSMTRQSNAPFSPVVGRATKATWRPSALTGAMPYDTS
ncbi:hypothetical protein SHIRM173S_08061 [Streptomyces hirsutus]